MRGVIRLVEQDRRRRFKNLGVGLFLYEGELCMKTEYCGDAYIVRTGEAFWGPNPQTAEHRDELLVTPLNVLR